MLTLMVTIDCPVSVETMGFGGGVADDLVDPGVRVTRVNKGSARETHTKTFIQTFPVVRWMFMDGFAEPVSHAELPVAA